MSNSFWGWFVDPYFNDPGHKNAIDYSDKHWYANETGSGTPEYPGDLISNQYKDSAAYVRECWQRFKERESWYGLREPIVRGEGGVWQANVDGQHPDITKDLRGTYFHKKLWAHVGILGYSCDGEWYPKLFVPYSSTQFPNATYDLAKMFAAYERFMQGEPLSKWPVPRDRHRRGERHGPGSADECNRQFARLGSLGFDRRQGNVVD